MHTNRAVGGLSISGRQRAASVALATMVAVSGAASAQAPKPLSAAGADMPAAVAGSGLPVPRFVSLKSDRVNLRNGPSTDYPVSWVYKRAGLPLEVIKEYEGWRQVRDAEGVTGWVLQSFLSGRRTGLVLPWELKPDKPAPQTPLFTSDSERSRPAAVVEAGVIANIARCDGKWCQVSIDKYRGFIEQNKLFGVYPAETVK